MRGGCTECQQQQEGNEYQKSEQSRGYYTCPLSGWKPNPHPQLLYTADVRLSNNSKTFFKGIPKKHIVNKDFGTVPEATALQHISYLPQMDVVLTE